MLIDKKVTKKIAFLARIGLSEKEEEEYSKDLSNILKWMEDLQKIDVKDVEPLRNVNDIELLEREDKDFSKNTEQQELLLNAPKIDLRKSKIDLLITSCPLSIDVIKKNEIPTTIINKNNQMLALLIGRLIP